MVYLEKFSLLYGRSGTQRTTIAPDFTGLYVPTHSKEEIRVKVEELDGEDAVYLVNVEELEDE